MHALPVDLIIEILCRLPVKSLLRFRCLSKQFRSIIDSSVFINSHLQYHSLEQRLIVGGACPKLLLLDLDSVDNAFKIELPFENWGHGFVHVIGSCDGLLALFHAIHNRNSIVLWNISTKKHQILPNCLSDFNERFNEFHRFGFGRDAATHDYKLVKMVNFFKTNVTEVSVYSLKANCWRRIDGFPRYSTYYLHDDMAAALVEGTLNWGGELVDAEERRKDFIVSFDLKNEIFFEVSLPDMNQEIEESTFSVMVLGGCLCLIYHYPHQLDIWVMKEYRVKDSWTKLYWLYPLTVLEFPPITKAFVYLKHGDKLFIFPNYGEVFQHDLKEREFEIIEIKLLSYISSVTIYVDSLVSPYVNN